MGRKGRMSKEVEVKQRLSTGQSAEQVHSDLAFPPHATCITCTGVRPMTRIIVLAPLDEARKKMPALEDAMQVDPDGFMKNIVRIKESPTDVEGKPYFRVSVSYFCKSCTPQAEKTAAKAPSWCIVEINRGPDPERILVSGIH